MKPFAACLQTIDSLGFPNPFITLFPQGQLETSCPCFSLCSGDVTHLYDTIDPYRIRNGGGSAYGGEAKPAKPADERFWGVPGEIKTTYPHGYRIDTKIGPDGRAERERHYTDHHRPDKHSVPHDHIINWEKPHHGQQNFEKPHINYWPSEYPDGAPEFKSYRGKFMNDSLNSEDDNRFKTISDFKNCIIRGGEVVFLWNGVDYAISSNAEKISISEGYKPETEKLYDTPDDVLEYKVGSDRLRDVITQVTVLDRTI